jgi:tetratricopeptide (TPR) repeat protein
MSRNGDDERATLGAGATGSASHSRRPRVVRAVLTALLPSLLAAGSVRAQGVPATPAPNLTPQVQQSLLLLQEGWLQWTGALYGGDDERAREVVADLLSTAERLGMGRLPDLSTGALVQAVESVQEGETERSALALETAERLDPGRPETAFAAARLARLRGAWFSALVEEARGYARLRRTGLERELALHDLFLWALGSLLLAFGLFVALQMGVRGPALVRDVAAFLGRRAAVLPRPVALVLAAAVLLWPLALPAGVLWLGLYWSLLLWGYMGLPERVVLVCGWLLLAASPVVIEEARERVALKLSPPVRALHSAAHGRLYGGLFTDLGVLPGALPGAPAVEHFLADLHVRLGQWDDARLVYEKVLEKEPENVPALVNLGAYYYHRGDYGNAVAFFQKATAPTGDWASVGAAAYWDLSLAYAASYLFDENSEALREARRIDNAQVNRWFRRPDRQRLVTVEGGIDRIPEIERALRREWSPKVEGSPGLELLRRARPALLLVLLGSLAMAFHALTGGGRRAAGDLAARQSAPGRWLPALVPGLTSAALGRGGRAYLALLAVAAPVLVLVTGGGELGYPIPWRYDPGGWLLPVAAGLALVLAAGARALRVARSS